MRNWLLKLLFPKEAAKIRLLLEAEPGMTLHCPLNVPLKDIQIYIVPSGESYSLMCTWEEWPSGEMYSESAEVKGG